MKILTYSKRFDNSLIIPHSIKQKALTNRAFFKLWSWWELNPFHNLLIMQGFIIFCTNWLPVKLPVAYSWLKKYCFEYKSKNKKREGIFQPPSNSTHD
jgi:hypothetical protein